MDRSLYIARIGSGFLQQKWNDSSRHFRSGGILVELSDKTSTSSSLVVLLSRSPSIYVTIIPKVI